MTADSFDVVKKRELAGLPPLSSAFYDLEAVSTAAGPDTALADLMAIDVHALSALHAQIPAGPYQAMRCGNGVITRHEVRQLDTRPDDKHHWPHRLLESISGQQARCDDAVFDFVAGVVNAWPLIAELCEEGLIARTLKADGAELRETCRAEGEDPDEAVARLDRIAAEVFAQNVVSDHKSPTRQTFLDVEAQPWPGMDAPVSCRVQIDYVDEDDWRVDVVEVPVEVTRFGPFEMPRPVVRLTADHPLGAGIIAWTARDPGAVEISDHVRDCLDEIAADPRGGD